MLLLLSWYKCHRYVSQIIESAGLDAAVLLRCLKFGMEAFVYISVVCCVILLPVNLTVRLRS